MSDQDAPPKSAFELAMERLQAEDRAAGIEHRPLTDKQKEQIAELRQTAKARIAELEILRQKNLQESGGDPERIHEINQHFEIDKGRVESKLESDVRAIKEKS